MLDLVDLKRIDEEIPAHNMKKVVEAIERTCQGINKR